MLLRISLVIAILAGLAGLYVGHFQVAEKINEISTKLSDTEKNLVTAQGAESKARGEAKKSKEEAERAKQELAAKAEALDATTARLAQQEKRANQQFEELTNAKKELNETRERLSVFLSAGVAPKDLKELKDTAERVAKERDVFAAENKVLSRNVIQLQTDLDRYRGTREVEPPMPAGLKGKVLAVDPKYDFVVLDIGGVHGVVEHGYLLVNRDGKLVGRVRITKVEPNRCIANVLPDWKQGEVMEGDQVLYAQ